MPERKKDGPQGKKRGNERGAEQSELSRKKELYQKESGDVEQEEEREQVREQRRGKFGLLKRKKKGFCASRCTRACGLGQEWHALNKTVAIPKAGPQGSLKPRKKEGGPRGNRRRRGKGLGVKGA